MNYPHQQHLSSKSILKPWNLNAHLFSPNHAMNEWYIGTYTYLASRVTLYLKMLCPVNAQIVPFTGSEHSPSNLPNLCTQKKKKHENYIHYLKYFSDILKTCLFLSKINNQIKHIYFFFSQK